MAPRRSRLRPLRSVGRELEQLTRRFTEKFHRHIGPHRDIPAPDVGTNEQIMGWMQDEYAKIYGHQPGVVTGKPVAVGGSHGRTEATGRGLATVLGTYLESQGRTPAGLGVAIQGFGNVGRHAAAALHADGFVVVAVSDVSGGVHSAEGLDLDRLGAHVDEGGVLAEFDGAEHISNAELLESQCDVLLPAALGRVITSSNAGRIRAPLILEGANGPVDPDADGALAERGVTIIPDVLANSGGVLVSFFEWVQNMQHLAWDLETVRSRAEKRLVSTTREVVERAGSSGCSLRDAGYEIAVQRVKEALVAAGI
ncbi:MAG: Glu/Leu/Phe/Val dehydrogenase [Microthrixaceae bacterium]